MKRSSSLYGVFGLGVLFLLGGLSWYGYAEEPPIVQLSFRVEPADYYSSLISLKKDIQSVLEKKRLTVINYKDTEEVYDVALEIDIIGTAIGANYQYGGIGGIPAGIRYTGAEVQGTIKGVTQSKTVEEAFSGKVAPPGKTSSSEYYKSQAPFYKAIEASYFWEKLARVVKETLDR